MHCRYPAQPAKSASTAGLANHAAVHSDMPELGSLQNTLSDVIQRLTNQWFGPAAEGWSRPKRFAYAFAGSLTFFLGWVFAIAAPDVKRLILGHLYQATFLSTHLYPIVA